MNFSEQLQIYYDKLEKNGKELKENPNDENLHNERNEILLNIKHHIRYGKR